MRIPKRYGSSRIDNCPFCGKIGVTKNKQGVPVCSLHKDDELKDMKCVCGSWLDTFEGKYGPYFKCMNCGNINFKKGIEMNPQVKGSSKSIDAAKVSEKKEDKKSDIRIHKKFPSEITVRSDQLDFLY